MAVVVDASFAAAWFLPDETSAATDDVARRLVVEPALIPDLFRHELRNVLLTAHRRGRLSKDDCLRQLARAEQFPLIDCGKGTASQVMRLAIKHRLSAYDPAYLSLAIDERATLATFDSQLAAAAIDERLKVIGSVAP